MNMICSIFISHACMHARTCTRTQVSRSQQLVAYENIGSRTIIHIITHLQLLRNLIISIQLLHMTYQFQ